MAKGRGLKERRLGKKDFSCPVPLGASGGRGTVGPLSPATGNLAQQPALGLAGPAGRHRSSLSDPFKAQPESLGGGWGGARG